MYPIRGRGVLRGGRGGAAAATDADRRQRGSGGLTGGRGAAAECCCGGDGEAEEGPHRRHRSLPHALPLAPPLWIRGETTASGRRGLRMPLPARFCCWTPRFRHLPLEQTAGRKGVSGSVTAAHEPAHLGGHDGDEVRTESWAVVEAGRGVWARSVVRHVGGARRAG